MDERERREINSTTMGYEEVGLASHFQSELSMMLKHFELAEILGSLLVNDGLSAGAAVHIGCQN